MDARSTERRTLAYREAIRSVTDRPVTTLINRGGAVGAPLPWTTESTATC